ncbi:MAG: sugar ABC transporter substrate-binding protein [Acidobacteria bacterium]|nr:MAG: sugar ABC transporter substrate-binding protein [Acidobacteriota bacterium]
MRFTIGLVVVVISIAFITTAHAQKQPADNAARAYGDGEFQLGPDDVVEVSVYQEKELSAIVPVRPDGKISIPLIGEMPASGKTAKELQKEITSKYAQFITEPAVTVVVKEVNSPKVSVLGEVKSPGVYKIKDRATVLDAIALAGGLTEYAKKDKITVIRVDPSGEQHHLKVNLDDQLKGRRLEPFYVLPYDKIYVQ